jgi:opacity protein-like surface antigen
VVAPRGAAGDAIRDEVGDAIQDRLDQVGDAIRDGIQDKLDDVGAAIRDAVADAVKEGLDARADEIQGNAEKIKAEIRRATQAAIQDLKRNASAKVRKALEKAEAELAQVIEDGMTKAANADLKESREWVDPYVGVRGRLNLTPRTYLGARADVGGFGVGSDLMLQLFGGVGYCPTQKIELEAGWRYMSVDYDKDNFLYDVAYSGFMIGARFKF